VAGFFIDNQYFMFFVKNIFRILVKVLGFMIYTPVYLWQESGNEAALKYGRQP